MVVFARSVMLKSWDGFESKEFFRVASQHEMRETERGPVRFSDVRTVITLTLHKAFHSGRAKSKAHVLLMLNELLKL